MHFCAATTPAPKYPAPFPSSPSPPRSAAGCQAELSAHHRRKRLCGSGRGTARRGPWRRRPQALCRSRPHEPYRLPRSCAAPLAAPWSSKRFKMGQGCHHTDWSLPAPFAVIPVTTLPYCSLYDLLKERRPPIAPKAKLRHLLVTTLPINYRTISIHEWKRNEDLRIVWGGCIQSGTITNLVPVDGALFYLCRQICRVCTAELFAHNGEPTGRDPLEIARHSISSHPHCP